MMALANRWEVEATPAAIAFSGAGIWNVRAVVRVQSLIFPSSKSVSLSLLKLLMSFFIAPFVAVLPHTQAHVRRISKLND